jgi:DNA-binding HxlR family transcriptional regulator
MDESHGMNGTPQTSTRDSQRLTTKSASESCRSTSCAASQLQGKWRVPILCVLRAGPVRLGELSRLLPEASKKMLMAELKRLVVAGLVVRRDLTGGKAVRHVEYCFAKPIETATVRLLQQLEEWNRATQAVANGYKSEHVR